MTTATPEQPVEEKTWRCNATTNGRRCNFRGTNPELEVHASDVGHPICDLCPRSLTTDEQRVCAKCISRTRNDLAEISRAHDQLPAVAHNAGYLSLAIPGGDALVILAGGNLTAHGPDDDARFGDPIPVAAALAAWEFDWRGHRNEPTALQTNIKTTTVYLRTRLTWAAAEYPGFSVFVRDIRLLTSVMTHTAGIADDPVKARAECFECGGRLLRVYRNAKGRTERLESVKHRVNTAAKRPQPASVKDRRAMVMRAVTGQDREGLTDQLRCAACGETYTWAQYALALRSRVESVEDWVLVNDAADVARVPHQSIRNWIDRGLIGARCDVLTHRVYVWWHDVQERAEALKRKSA